MVGATERTCLNTGGWTGLPPQCQYVDCGPPPPIAVGSVGLPTRATYYGAVAEYSCPERYQLIGQSRLICGAEGGWSDPPPTCKGTAERGSEGAELPNTADRWWKWMEMC